MRRPLTIDFTALPHRARPLGEDELSEVFGGCSKAGEPCTWGVTCCCDNMWCAESLQTGKSACTPHA